MVINVRNKTREENIEKRTRTCTCVYTCVLFEVVKITSCTHIIVSRMCYDDEHKINIATMPRYFGIVLRFRYHSGPHFLINTTQLFSRRRVHVQYKV